MDYFEFCERSGDNVTREEYERIEVVYLNHPDILDVPAMLEFWKKNGKMKGIDLLYPLARDLAKEKENAKELKRANHQIGTLQAEVDAENTHLRGIIEMYRDLVPMDVLLGRMTRLQAEEILSKGAEE